MIFQVEHLCFVEITKHIHLQDHKQEINALFKVINKVKLNNALTLFSEL